MRKLNRLALAAIMLSLASFGGENKYLGAIVVSGASLTNATTAAPFVITPGSKITINCSAAVNILVDNLTTAATGATKGLPVAASSNFPTSVGQARGPLISGNPTAAVAVFGTGTCDFWLRDGNE